MDDYKDCSSNIQNCKKLSQFHFLKKTIQILLSICVFSVLILSQYSLLTSTISYFDHYMSIFSIKLFHYNSERNYIFLLFNGILVVILKNSGFVRKPAINNSSYEVSDSRKKTTQVTKEEAIKEAMEIGKKIPERGGEAEKEETQGRIVVKEEDLKDEDQEEEEEEQHEMMSLDELNKKCDEFIKKMREGIMFNQFRPISRV
ncbi:hypothetical protein M9H77_04290 [Catharanthus roseus]|uniref:Uncharacterized protein n=1 Tax=Catharanthus roseus TaxID=4058 RepID=A0ACC0CDP2_CATRO|nr:hypothetical protein M9H77_04290 [Catharanthus roseus]